MTIYETTKSGTLLVKVSGYDIDNGRNGELRYSIDPTGVGIDIPRYLMIDSLSGQITLIESIPREVVPSGLMSIPLVLNDKGSPSLTDTAVLNIFVKDVNNHCPVFSSPAPDEVILVNASVAVNTTLVSVKAQDDDYGENGLIRYNLVSELDTPWFEIESDLGFIYLVTKPLPVGIYSLTVTAADHGETPCVSERIVIIQVYPASLPSETLNRVAPPITPSPTTTSAAVTTEVPLITTKSPASTRASTKEPILEQTKTSSSEGKPAETTAVNPAATATATASILSTATKSEFDSTSIGKSQVSENVTPDGVTRSPEQQTTDATEKKTPGSNLDSTTINITEKEQPSSLPLIITGAVLGAVLLIAFVIILALLVHLKNMRVQAAKKDNHSPLASVSLPSITEGSDAYRHYEPSSRYYR